MIKVVIIGSGNVAQHLVSSLKKSKDVELIQLFSRNNKSLHLPESNLIVSSFSELKKADLYLIAVSDDAISEVSAKIPFTNQLVVHTSGSVSINELDSKNRKGVFYPLQTFSKDKEIDFSIIPICLESESEKDYDILETVAKSISDVVIPIDSIQRKSLHVAAVFVSNFVNHLYKIGHDISIENNIPFNILKPLIMETADKVNSLSPFEAQTGPAKRNDTKTINSHLNFLTDSNQKEIYKLLTKSIIDNGKKL